MRLEKYNEFFKLFKTKEKTMPKENINELCAEHVMNFLRENSIITWEGYNNISLFQQDVIDALIDNTDPEFDESYVRFLIRLKLSNKEELMSFLKELEKIEEYEKCSMVLKKISKL